MFGGGKRKTGIWVLVAILVVPPLSDFVSWSLWRQTCSARRTMPR
jgi:hypothetical protein